MAKLTIKQANEKIAREKEKQEALKKKKLIEEKKALFGENWRLIEQQNIQKELEVELGSEDTPKIYDFKDVYDFFDPIVFYTDRENKRLEMDYDQFIASEERFQQALDDIENDIYQLNKKDKDKDNGEESNGNETGEDGINKDDPKAQKVQEYKDFMEHDGEFQDVVETGKPEEKIKNENGELSVASLIKYANEIAEDMEDDLIVDDLDDEESKGLDKELKSETMKRRALNKMKFAPAGFTKKQLNDRDKVFSTISAYFNRFTPLYNKHVCTCCGAPKNINNFYITLNIMCSNRIDNKGNLHMYVCKECCNKLLAYYYSIVTKKDLVLAMQYLCATLNLYWDLDAFFLAKRKFEDSDRKGTLIGEYILLINNDFIGKTFVDSPILKEGKKIVKELNVKSKESITDAPYDWSKEDAKNKKDVIKIFGYDPFQYEENDAEKKILYADLVSVIDEEVAQDYVKMQSALTIVKSFNKVRKLDEKAHLMEKNSAPLSEQKSIADLKSKELKAISDFSRDSGFSERFKSKQNQGQTSFTGIVKAMNERQYENELINKYDIQTSSTIQAAADASFKAIFGQLNLSEAEAFKIAQEQLGELRKLRQENDKLKEDLRLSRYEATELRLREKARSEGKDVDELDEDLDEDINNGGGNE